MSCKVRIDSRPMNLGDIIPSSSDITIRKVCAIIPKPKYLKEVVFY